jgi:Leucine-rich repeat (LRR) protein
MQDNIENNTNNSLVPLGSKGLVRLKNSIAITDKILNESKLRPEYLINWWNNLDQIWRTILCANFYGKDAYNRGIEQNFSAEQISEILKIRKLEYNILSEGSYIPPEDLIGDISPINQLTELTHISFSESLKCQFKIDKMSPKTTSITIQFNNLNDLSFLRFYPNLKHLDLWANSIDDIEYISNLTELVFLNIGGNSITDLSPLASLKKLKKLNVSCNNINSIEPISKIITLTYLDLHTNQIVDLSPLENLINLNELNIDDNKFTSIAPVSNLKELNTLWSRNNIQVNDYLSLKSNEKLMRLYINWSNVDNTIIKELRKELPNCEIYI